MTRVQDSRFGKMMKVFPWKPALAVIVFLVFTIYFLYPEKSIKLIKNISWQTWANIVLATIAILSYRSTRKSKKMVEKLYGAQIRPLIQTIPRRFKRVNTHGVTELKVVNYTNFDAFNVQIDLKYGDNDWIIEWVNAQIVNFALKVEVHAQFEEQLEFWRGRRPRAIDLRAGDSTSTYITGSVPSIEHYDSIENEIEVLVRTIWENEREHVFDRMDRYRLVCTRVGTGTSFNFIPDYERKIHE